MPKPFDHVVAAGILHNPNDAYVSDLKVRFGQTCWVPIDKEGLSLPPPSNSWDPTYLKRGGHSREVRYKACGGYLTKESAIKIALRKAKDIALSGGLVSFVQQKIFGQQAPAVAAVDEGEPEDGPAYSSERAVPVEHSETAAAELSHDDGRESVADVCPAQKDVHIDR